MLYNPIIWCWWRHQIPGSQQTPCTATDVAKSSTSNLLTWQWIFRGHHDRDSHKKRYKSSSDTRGRSIPLLYFHRPLVLVHRLLFPGVSHTVVWLDTSWFCDDTNTTSNRNFRSKFTWARHTYLTSDDHLGFTVRQASSFSNLIEYTCIDKVKEHFLSRDSVMFPISFFFLFLVSDDDINKSSFFLLVDIHWQNADFKIIKQVDIKLNTRILKRKN